MKKFGLLLLLPVVSLFGGTIDTPVISFDLPGGTVTGTFAQFDPSLGTLTGVTLFYQYVNVTMTATAIHPQQDGVVSIFADFMAGAELTLPDIATIDPFVQTNALHFGCQAGSHEFNSCFVTASFPSGPLAGSILLSPSPDLSAYIGLSTVPYAVTSISNITNIVASPAVSNPIGTDLGESDTTVYGDMFLEYTYQTATVATPEPGSIVLVGISLLILGTRAKCVTGRVFRDTL